MHSTGKLLIFVALFLTENCLGQGKIKTTTTATAAPSVTTTTSVTTTSVTEPTDELIERKKTPIRQQLRNLLLQDYDPHVHPTEDHGKPVKVKLGMAIIHFAVDEFRSIMAVDSWMRIAWKDEHLAWNPMDFENLTQIHFSIDELWKPDIHLYNNADEANLEQFGRVYLVVSYNGDVLWVPPAHFKAFCKLDLRYWPFDEQKCTLKFGSWTSHGDQIALELYRNMTEAEMLNLYTDNMEWQLKEKPVADQKNRYYSCCSEGYPDVTFTFNIKRTAPGYRSIIVLPCIVIMLMTGTSFLLTPQSGEKVTINSLAIVCIIMFLVYFAWSIPFHSSSVPLLVTFYSNTLALVSIALLLNVVCMTLSRERKYTGPPKRLTKLFSGWFGKSLCLGNYTHQVSTTHQRLVVELDDMADSELATDTAVRNNGNLYRPEQRGRLGPASAGAIFADTESSIIMREWNLVAAGIERLFFLIYFTAFAVITTVYA